MLVAIGDWFIQGLSFARPMKQMKRKEVCNINKNLIKIKESKLDGIWLTQGETGVISG